MQVVVQLPKHSSLFVNPEDQTEKLEDGKTHNQIDHILIDQRWHSSKLEVSGELIVILITVWWLQKLGKDWQ